MRKLLAVIGMFALGCGSISQASTEDIDGTYQLQETITGGSCQDVWRIGLTGTDTLTISNDGNDITLASTIGTCSGEPGSWVCELPEPSGATTDINFQAAFGPTGSVSGTETISSSQGCTIDLSFEGVEVSQ
jgi:hypothetical protein